MGEQSAKDGRSLQKVGNGMIIIGEKINGAIPKTAEAIQNRDRDYILEIVRKQEAAGADYLDVCAGTTPEEEYDALCWLLDLVQENSEVPICIDSPDPHMLERVFPKLKQPGIINSISGEGDKAKILFPLLQSNPQWKVIILCCDKDGIPTSADDKVRIAKSLLEMADQYNIDPERIHIDPLVLALPAVNDSALQFCQAIRRIKELSPTVNITAALSNISFGMPVRALLNRNFLTMAMLAGLDSVIADPTNREVIGNIYATEALMGKDKFCRNYNKAYRANKIGKIKV